MKQQKNVSNIVNSLQKHIKTEIKNLDRENKILLNRSKKHFRNVLSKDKSPDPQNENATTDVRRKSCPIINNLKPFVFGFFALNRLHKKFFDNLKKRAKATADFISSVFSRKKFKE